MVCVQRPDYAVIEARHAGTGCGHHHQSQIAEHALGTIGAVVFTARRTTTCCCNLLRAGASGSRGSPRRRAWTALIRALPVVAGGEASSSPARPPRA